MNTVAFVLSILIIGGIFALKRFKNIPIPNFLTPLLLAFAGLLMLIGLFNKIFFYAEPGYVYHVRTITGQEKVISDVGFNSYLFGRYNAWKRAMTVQSSFTGNTQTVTQTDSDQIDAEDDAASASAILPPLNIVFLDQVDANIEATVRFSMPTDREAFLKMVHEYRNPANLLRTALIPAFKETLQATGSLMSAEDYYSGGRSEFNSEFEGQIIQGLLLVKREEKLLTTAKAVKGSANVALGTQQEEYGDETKTVFSVVKVLDEHGLPKRKRQKFTDYGIAVIEARITNVIPNQKFVERMQLKQKASADRAVAREQRIQEEEQRLLAIARGEREVAERQAKAKVEQIQHTTEAETEKQLAITNALKLKEQAVISKETAEIELEKARIEAQTKQTLADAEAYQRRVILHADNALAQKLDAEVKIQGLWAQAYAKRAVPTNVFGASEHIPQGKDDEAKNFMRLLTLDAATRLNYQRQVLTPAVEEKK